MRLIDADSLKKELCKEYRHFDQRIKHTPVFTLLRDAPTIDAVEVVRCKDCVNFSEAIVFTGKCTLRDDYIFTNDFCSYGERRTDERAT